MIFIVSKDALGAVTQQVDQAYDLFQRWVHRSVDSDGAGPSSAADTFFTYEGNQIALEFDGNTASDLAHRYLWGDMVDQILADEQVSSLASAGDVIYPLTDHLNTTRDLATYDAGTDVTTNANHRRFDSFGNLISQTNGSITILVGFTARPLDAATGLQWNLNRWYVSTLGTWMSEDPIEHSDDVNLTRYVRNSPVTSLDPLGLWRYTPDLGRVFVTLQSSQNGFAAGMTANFIPDKAAFATALPGNCTVALGFVQIVRIQINHSTLGKGVGTVYGIQLDKWYVDGLKSEYPYYTTENGTLTGNKLINPYPSMVDEPGNHGGRKSRIQDVSYEFETAVVSKNSAGTIMKGDVLANFEWGFSHYVKGYSWSRFTVDRKYYINDVVFDETLGKKVLMTSYDGTEEMKEVGGATRKPDGMPRYASLVKSQRPSSEMEKVLSANFP